MKMIRSISERLAAKLGNANDNAFKMRRLFKMYDTEKSGCIQLEDFRMMMETFGIQLDDDSLLALFCIYDHECTGAFFGVHPHYCALACLLYARAKPWDHMPLST